MFPLNKKQSGLSNSPAGPLVVVVVEGGPKTKRSAAEVYVSVVVLTGDLSRRAQQRSGLFYKTGMFGIKDWHIGIERFFFWYNKILMIIDVMFPSVKSTRCPV